MGGGMPHQPVLPAGLPQPFPGFHPPYSMMPSVMDRERISPFLLLAQFFELFASWMWKDAALDVVDPLGVEAGRRSQEHPHPMRVFPPHCLAGENATRWVIVVVIIVVVIVVVVASSQLWRIDCRSITVSTLSAIRAELSRGRNIITKFLESRPQPHHLVTKAEEMCDELFCSADFFRESEYAMFIMVRRRRAALHVAAHCKTVARGGLASRRLTCSTFGRGCRRRWLVGLQLSARCAA